VRPLRPVGVVEFQSAIASSLIHTVSSAFGLCAVEPAPPAAVCYNMPGQRTECHTIGRSDPARATTVNTESTAGCDRNDSISLGMTLKWCRANVTPYVGEEIGYSLVASVDQQDFGLTAALEVNRVGRPTVHPNFVVKVRTCAPSGATDFTNHGTAGDAITDFGQ
jgi:hypothetical protein